MEEITDYFEAVIHKLWNQTKLLNFPIEIIHTHLSKEMFFLKSSECFRAENRWCNKMDKCNGNCLPILDEEQWSEHYHLIRVDDIHMTFYKHVHIELISTSHFIILHIKFTLSIGYVRSATVIVVEKVTGVRISISNRDFFLFYFRFCFVYLNVFVSERYGSVRRYVLSNNVACSI